MTTKNTKDTSYPKPFYAVAGAGELAVEQLRKLPETATKLRNRVETELKKVDLAEARDRVQTEVKDLRGKVKSEVTGLRKRIADVRTKQVSKLDADKLRTTASDAVNDLVDTAQKQFKAASKQAADVYEGLATRGKDVVGEKPATKTGPAAKTTTKAAPKAAKAVKASKPATKPDAGSEK